MIGNGAIEKEHLPENSEKATTEPVIFWLTFHVTLFIAIDAPNVTWLTTQRSPSTITSNLSI